MSLVATAILVGYTREVEAMLHDCSYYDLEEGMEVTNNHLCRSGRLQRDSRCQSHSDEKTQRDTDVFCRVPWSGHPLYQNLDYYTQRTAEAFQEDMLLCNPVIQHSHVRMITMPYSHMPLSNYDLFKQSLCSYFYYVFVKVV